MSKPSARERLAGAAFELFDERGYEQTTVDDITERAGLGRTTFFRHYRSKEDVIFPDHDRLLEQIADRLRIRKSRRCPRRGLRRGPPCPAASIGEGDLAAIRYLNEVGEGTSGLSLLSTVAPASASSLAQ